MEPDAPVTRRRTLLYGWRGLVILSVLGLGGMVVATVFWFFSDGDLRRIEREMASAGLPTTWQELGVKRTDADRVKIYERVTALARVVKPWRPKQGSSALHPGEPVPIELKTWHEQMPSTELAELLRLIDALPAEQPFLIEDYSVPANTPWIGKGNEVLRLLGQRVALAAEQDVPVEARRLLHLLNVIPRIPTNMGSLIDSSFLSFAARFLAIRLPAIRGDSGLAEGLESLVRRLESLREQQEVGSLIVKISDFRSVQQGRAFSREGLEYRFTRERNLQGHFAWILQSRACQPGFARIDLAKRMLGAAKTTFNFAFGNLNLHDSTSTEHSVLKARLTAEVMATEIRGIPWPVDPYARDGARLRRLERNGVLIGAYSIGRDGVDDHGGKDDDGFALYGPLKVPTPAAVTSASPQAAPVSAPSAAAP